VVDGRALLSARAWAAVYESLGPGASAALDRGQHVLDLAGRRAWSRHDCLAATLIAERLFERGDHEPARRLLSVGAREQAARGDEWGQAFCAVVGARGRLRTGDLFGARRQAERQLRRFLALGDLAGQASSLDVIGYCAEATGDLSTAAEAHARGIDLAHRAGAPGWEASHLVRLGSVGVLAERPDAVGDLVRAWELSASVGADAVTAACRNGLGLAHACAGDATVAADHHQSAYEWYTTVGSRAGEAYSGARVAMVSGDAERAAASVRAAITTSDPRAVAHSLEAVALTSPEADAAARALGAATSLRDAAGDRLAAPLKRVLTARADELLRALGPTAYESLCSEGTAQPLAEAVRW
jgi:hypothetical protein